MTQKLLPIWTLQEEVSFGVPLREILEEALTTSDQSPWAWPMLRRLRRSILAGLFLACGTQAIADQPLKLDSGKVVGIISIGPVISTHGWSALMLNYRTSLPITDIESLRLEADEIWARLIVDAERGGYSQAIISANTPQTGFIVKTGKALGFTFRKIDGSWRTDETGRPTGAKLDEAFIRAFEKRLDWEDGHNNMNGLLLYLANDFVFSLVDQTTKSSSKQQLDRMQFAAAEHASLSAASNLHHTRDILRIVIGNGGTSAQVVSHETVQMTAKGHVSNSVADSTDTFQWQDGIMLLKRSETVLQSSITR